MTHPTVFGGATPPPANYQISNSVRMNGTSTYFTRSSGVQGNRRQMSGSVWLKRSKLGVVSSFWNGADVVGYRDFIGFNSSDQLIVQLFGAALNSRTMALYRDLSAWMHVVWAIDTTQSASANKVKAWVNGQQVHLTFLDDAVAQNTELYTNSSGPPAYFGKDFNGAYFDGYLSDFHWCDGQVLTADSFGKFDANGVWVPIKYEGTYGTNGCKLEFKNAAALGADTSGNDNHWTVNGLTAGDQTVDTPTCNFATWSPIDKSSVFAMSGGNTVCTVSSQIGGDNCRATIAIDAKTAGGYYWETTVGDWGGGQNADVGIIGLTEKTVNFSGSYGIGQCATGYSVNASGQKANNNSHSAYMGSAPANGIVLAHLLKNGKYYVGSISGGTITWYNSGNPADETWYAYSGLSGYFLPAVGFGASVSRNISVTGNFGSTTLAAMPPSGAKTICTANLPAVAIPQPKKHFDVLLHSGTGAARTISGLSFQPDLVWAKDRSQVYNHGLFDSLRGAGNVLSSSNMTPETNYPQELTSFDADGFSVGTGTGNFINKSGNAYVDWCWKAGGAAVANTAGSITSQVSANPAAGFSIVTYTGNGASGATIGHGLGAEPKLIIIKSRSNSSSNWIARHASLTAGNDPYLYLNETANQLDSGGQFWNNTPPSSTVVTLGNNTDVNQSAKNYVIYCFAEITGYSKFGSFTGNGSIDGAFVYLGFRARYFMWKRINSTMGWVTFDSATSTYNAVSKGLYANIPGAEGTIGNGNYIDVTASGVKFRDSIGFINASGGTYIYAAFAEHPFGGSNVAPSPAR